MAESSRDVAKRIYDAADMDQVARLAPQLQEVMLSEEVGYATAAMMVSTLVGWFVSTLNPDYRQQFEQCIEVNFEIAAEL